ncbi:3-oxoacyl-ACP reductase family protein [Alicyclobacillus sp. SO9]|uniref:3-oxoacyl-ACP reductase family protein n=1 Tax=Alicyclobacillus sp. SO9 TaxID=2665646 RepID=UPI0018E8954E|nr:3-oxoacyl-ACP reductase family protein [Alicyclobacillus sp. SO9]QQE77383.1 3-oxoacyl-ACP reductase FabG [Alicyclobacillus sp. SO9]
MAESTKVAIVTGGTRGLGRDIAKTLAADGYYVVVNYRSSAVEAAQVVNEIVDLGGEAMSYQADVSSREAVLKLTNDIVERAGRIDVLINNAGLNIDRPFLEMTSEEWSSVMKVNLDGTFHCTQIVANTMMKLGIHGSILNMSASTALHGREDGANYCASKAGVMALTKCTALELAPQIRVNCIVPGFIETQEVVDRFSLDDDANKDKILDSIPLRRLGQSQDIANMVSFLCSDKASYITGQMFFVNGGNYMG